IFVPLAARFPAGYNKMAEICFNRVRRISPTAQSPWKRKSVWTAASKLIHSNHRLMAAYVLQMPKTVQRRMAEYEKKSVRGHQAICQSAKSQL
ncbi:hypothetical protein GDO86_020412, partial [Hymenochirus boettgeri]